MQSSTHEHLEIKLGDTSNIKTFKAKIDQVKILHNRVGLSLPPDPMGHIRTRIKEAIKNNRNVRMAIEVCVHCGVCLDNCPTYVRTKDIYNSPVGRAELIRAFLKADSVSGRLFGKAVGAVKLTEEYLEKIYTYYYQCLECRKCAYSCPFGIDQADVTRLVREIMYEAGIVSRYVATVIDAVERTGTNLGMKPVAVIKSITFAAGEIKEEKKVDVIYYIYRDDTNELKKYIGDKEVASWKLDAVPPDERPEALLVPPSADFFTNIETLKGYMLFLHLIGVKYAFSTEMAELANFGLFVSERHLHYIGMKVVNAALKLGVKTVIAGECGHGWRAFKNYTGPELERRGMKTLHIFHLVIDAIKRGAIKLNPDANGDIVYTFQDSCNYARGGDLTEEPRFIMRHVVKKYTESPHNREKTWCCGGGGGLLTDELLPLRIQYAKNWYEDALQVGASHVVRACAICKAQLSHTIPYLNKEYKREITYSGLMDLVYRALVV
ncbi:(Fe-S)-binding protein [Thermoproteus tenax]|uniref:Conserved iron sulfur protein n=1 Tax=Thermoproteus tenax (strain ATCC 35583 / DSM 2078 / JCM 9277 / NBRC 100435 / Kra 1) TaxID=768679 RepID=G4RNF7_THETK|nr:(Fe-S)-binding protein [Thermoproteus tenax]CCC81101.1 conserved iron sulfur protein [Thermoproteus tenax Kra 1]